MSSNTPAAVEDRAELARGVREAADRVRASFDALAGEAEAYDAALQTQAEAVHAFMLRVPCQACHDGAFPCGIGPTPSYHGVRMDAAKRAGLPEREPSRWDELAPGGA